MKTFHRKNAWELGDEWSDPFMWYAFAVEDMRKRPLADRTSWRFLAGIHGFEVTRWVATASLGPNDDLPSDADQKRFWFQCQHQSWYFLPWHRGYVMAFEKIVRATIVKLGGPADWALPYWNYSKAGQNSIPLEFDAKGWPPGRDINPLYSEWRFGPANDMKIVIPPGQINLNALTEPNFTGAAGGGSPGFGGPETGFSHNGNVSGRLEDQPHNIVHVLIGGSHPDTRVDGWMTDPATAGLDPIFWLHHANIDRLWQIWRQSAAAHLDPTAANWLNGPASAGGPRFSMPTADGGVWDYTPSQMTNYDALDYDYDDLTAPVSGTRRPPSGPPRLGDGRVDAGEEGAELMAVANETELIGANDTSLQVTGREARTAVRLDTKTRAAVGARLEAARSDDMAARERLFLNLENVRGAKDGTVFDVYVGLPEDADPADHPGASAGSIGLFGVRQASRADGEHGGQGITFVLDITDIADSLHLAGELDADRLAVRIVPANPVAPEDNITVERVSLFRQGG